MIFDVQTYGNAMKTAAALVGESSVGFATVDDYASGLYSRPYEIQCRHLTSSLNGCADISNYGLASWSELLVNNTELRRRLSSVGIEYDCNNGFSINGMQFGCPGTPDPTRGLQKDDCISAYLVCGGTEQEYSKSPEIMRRMRIACSGDTAIERMVEDWEQNARPFCVSFTVDPDDVDVITGYYSTDPDEASVNIETTLAEVLYNVIGLSSRSVRGEFIPIILKHGIKISPDRLQVQAIDDLEWDWRQSANAGIRAASSAGEAHELH